MSRTLGQRMADAHEADITEDISGALHKGSGNQWHRPMDSSNGEFTVPFPIAADGKATLGKGISITRAMWAKAVEQTVGRIPTIWLRWYRDEGLRTVDLDLVVIGRRDFNEILEKARLFESWENGAREDLAAIERERHPLLEVTLPAPAEGGVCGVGGCDCCR